MGRRISRKHSFFLIFQIEFHKDFDIEKIFDNYILEVEKNLSKEDINFIKNEFYGVYNNISTIDEIISKNLKNWLINRLNKVDLAILRLALYEINYVSDIPSCVSVNEAVEIAKKYSSDESPSFINGILGHILKDMENKIYE